jgi:hypothetical protein
MVADDPAVSERRALPARPPDTTKIMRPFRLGHYLNLMRTGSRRTGFSWALSDDGDCAL